ncbi:MAG: hypothetical protein JXA25_05200 [Anaerolineales bacterium]|nr:hypothetical protein [Anaerolineales bacterium]
MFLYCNVMSRSIMLALAADEIVMDENAVLGPIDPKLGEIPEASTLNVLEQKEMDRVDDRMLVYAYSAHRSWISCSSMYALSCQRVSVKFIWKHWLRCFFLGSGCRIIK